MAFRVSAVPGVLQSTEVWTSLFCLHKNLKLPWPGRCLPRYLGWGREFEGPNCFLISFSFAPFSPPLLPSDVSGAPNSSTFQWVPSGCFSSFPASSLGLNFLSILSSDHSLCLSAVFMSIFFIPFTAFYTTSERHLIINPSLTRSSTRHLPTSQVRNLL